MLQLQLVFSKTEDLKQKAKIIKHSIADALQDSRAYQEARKNLEAVKSDFKNLEEAIKADYRKELEELIEIKEDLRSEQQMMSDMAINNLVKGEALDIQDKKGNRLEPVFSVKFRKAK